MDDLEVITHQAHPRIKRAALLRKFRGRDQDGYFLVEGFREVSKALAAGFLFESVFVSVPIKANPRRSDLITDLSRRRVPLVYCAEKVMSGLSCREDADGFLAVVQDSKSGSENFLKTSSESPIYLVIEGLEKPGNVGAIFRCGDATGIDGIFFCDPCVDLYNPGIVRTSLGTVFSVPVVELSREETFSRLREYRIPVITTCPDASLRYTDIDYSGPVTLVFGSESRGISEFWRKRADFSVCIPMKGAADSLNVAMSVAVVLYEALKQRERYRE